MKVVGLAVWQFK